MKTSTFSIGKTLSHLGGTAVAVAAMGLVSPGAIAQDNQTDLYDLNLYDLNGNKLSTLRKQRAQPSSKSIALSPDGKLLVETYCSKPELPGYQCRRQAKHLTAIRHLDGELLRIFSGAFQFFTQDGSHLVTQSLEGELKKIQVHRLSGQEVAALDGQYSQLSTDNRYLLAYDYKGELGYHNLNVYDFVSGTVTSVEGRLSHFSKDFNVLITFLEDEHAKTQILDLDTRKANFIEGKFAKFVQAGQYLSSSQFVEGKSRTLIFDNQDKSTKIIEGSFTFPKSVETPQTIFSLRHVNPVSKAVLPEEPQGELQDELAITFVHDLTTDKQVNVMGELEAVSPSKDYFVAAIEEAIPIKRGFQSFSYKRVYREARLYSRNGQTLSKLDGVFEGFGAGGEKVVLAACGNELQVVGVDGTVFQKIPSAKLLKISDDQQKLLFTQGSRAIGLYDFKSNQILSLVTGTSAGFLDNGWVIIGDHTVPIHAEFTSDFTPTRRLLNPSGEEILLFHGDISRLNRGRGSDDVFVLRMHNHKTQIRNLNWEIILDGVVDSWVTHFNQKHGRILVKEKLSSSTSRNHPDYQTSLLDFDGNILKTFKGEPLLFLPDSDRLLVAEVVAKREGQELGLESNLAPNPEGSAKRRSNRKSLRERYHCAAQGAQ